MKAVMFDPITVAPVLGEFPVPIPDENEVVVKIHGAALNHRDLHITNPNAKDPFIYGSDGAGVIASVGEDVHNWRIGDEVIINSEISCGECYYCVRGEHALCETEVVLGSKAWPGTLAEYVKVPARNLVKKPRHLDFYQAAALPLAFGTAWNVLNRKANLKAGETLLIEGIGGGVALYCLQIAVAIGAKVIVTSGSDGKLRKAIEMGAVAGINYKTEDVVKRVKEITEGRGANVIVSSNGKTITTDIELAAKMGRIVQYAYIGQKVDGFNMDLVMGKHLRIMGSSMHSVADFDEAIAFIIHKRLVPEVSTVLPIEKFKEGFDMLKKGEQFGKIVFSIIS